jgi:hypothetical protein
MHRLAAQPQPVGRDQALVGLLFEADFEEETAKLRLPDGGVVTVAFRRSWPTTSTRCCDHRRDWME